MSDDMDDDLDGVEDTEVSDQLDDSDDDSDGEVAASKPRKKNAQPEELESASLEAKEREREMLARQMEEFLSRGGKVQEIDSNVVSDPPRKPDNKYGSRPI
ncbi:MULTISPECIES: hypothetical protein [Halopseudomonas]|uniref:Transcriptional regulator SutA n=1 Tax=Halopseudomonas sabulinigri TaxID=472181 RepID=A0ABP9ZU49_9GAMM